MENNHKIDFQKCGICLYFWRCNRTWHQCNKNNLSNLQKGSFCQPI